VATVPPPQPAPPQYAQPQYQQAQYQQAPQAPIYHGTAQVVGPGYVEVSYVGPVETVARLRPLYVGFLAIPQLFGAFFAGIVAAFSTYAAMFGILLMGRVHPRSHDNIVRAYRYQWRLTTFLLCWRAQPPAAPAAGAMDQGDDPARLSIAYGGEGLSRFGPIIKPFVMIVALFKVFFLMIGAYFTMLFGMLNVLTSGQFPQDKRDKITAVYRQATELNAYLLLHDVRPAG
jgi:hypothetical protein